MTVSTLFNKNYRYLIYGIFVLVFIFILFQDMNAYKDGEGYINAHINRTALYPIFLQILKTVFGTFFNPATAFIQGVIGLFSVYVFSETLKKELTLHPIWHVFATALLVVPFVTNFKIANSFLSEALAYPLYLLVLRQFIKAMENNTASHLLKSIPLLLLLLLTRNQFLFLVPVAILMLSWDFYKNRNFKPTLIAITAFLLIPFISNVLDKTYHKIVHDQFVSTPWTGIHLMTPAIYVADKTDVNLFKTEKERVFFSAMFDSLVSQNLNIHHLPKNKKNSIVSEYRDRYSTIANATLYNYGKENLAPNETVNSKYIILDKTTRAMTLPLIKDNFTTWFTLYSQNVVIGFGTSKHVLLLLILLIFGVISEVKRDDINAKFIVLGSLLLFGNMMLVAIGMHTIKRFTFYNDWILFLIVFILLQSYSTRKNTL